MTLSHAAIFRFCRLHAFVGLTAVAALFLAWTGGASAQRVIHKAKTELPQLPDLYNLGPIGGKADILTDGLPDNAKGGLKVAEVYKDGPGAKAGLKSSDIIYGSGATAFGANPYLELAAAIETAKVASKAEEAICTLLVKRGEVLQKLPVTLRAWGPDAAGTEKPGAGMRDELLQISLKWLASQVRKDGSYACNFSVTNGEVALASLAGLAMLCDGHKAQDTDACGDALEKIAQFVFENVGVQKSIRQLDGKNTTQSNWSLGYGGIFLAALYDASDPKWLRGHKKLKNLKSKLQWVVKEIFKCMEDSGGFAAGPGGPNALGYVELEIVSNFVLAALGCIKSCGIDVDEKNQKKSVDYLLACVDESGGVRYSTRPNDAWSADVGRTAGGLNALASLGLKQHETFIRMADYVRQHASKAFQGHATPTMHELALALACRTLGDDDFAAYWKHHRKEFTMVRNPDGTFSYRPTSDTLMLGHNMDRNLGLVWTTAHWALILTLDKGGLTLWRGAKPDVKTDAGKNAD